MIDNITVEEDVSLAINDLKSLNIIKVSVWDQAVAGAIASVSCVSNHAEVQAIGAGAVNQAVRLSSSPRLFGRRRRPHHVCPILRRC